MAPEHRGSGHAAPARAASTDVPEPPGSLAGTLTAAWRYAARTYGCAAGVRGIALEWAWLSAHLALYPVGALRERPHSVACHRTDPLPPRQRGLVVLDPVAASTPVVLLHGLCDNRSAFTLFRRVLRGRGFRQVHALNNSPVPDDVRAAAADLGRRIEELLDETGAERVHVVGHSLGGIVARYYVQRLGGSATVDTLVTLGSPHTGTVWAHLLPTRLGRQLRPGSGLMRELAAPAPDCDTRFLVVWSRLDEVVVPQGTARLRHPDLDVTELELCDVGHLSLPVDARTMRWVADRLARPSDTRRPNRMDRRRSDGVRRTIRDRATPAS